MSEYDALKLDHQLCFPLYAASREVIKLYHTPLGKLGLTYTQYITMMVLWEEKEITVKDLGKRLYLDSGTLTPVLKTLEKDGYITRTRSSEDERVLVVKNTKKGEQLKDQVVDIPKEIGSCVCLSEQDAKDLYRILYSILNTI